MLNAKANELVKEKYSDEAFYFKLSHKRFEGFCRRYRTSLWRETHAAQNSSAALRWSHQRPKQELLHLRSSFNQRHGVMKRSWRSGSERIRITFSTTYQLLDLPAKFFRHTHIEPSKHPMLSTGFINAKQPWLMSQEVQRAKFNNLMWVLTSHSRIMHVSSSKNV